MSLTKKLLAASIVFRNNAPHHNGTFYDDADQNVKRKKMKSKALITVLMLPVLFGCAAIPKYVVSEGTATANLKSAIVLRPGDSLNVYASNGTCVTAKGRNELLFTKEDSNGYKKVVANEPLRLAYCGIRLEVTLEEGKSYSMVGGVSYESGAIPILSGREVCRAGVIDDKTRELIPAKRCD